MTLTYRIETTPDGHRVIFAGPINEKASAALAGLESQVGKNCVFNLKGIEYVNSVGIRGWIQFLRDFQEGRDVRFEECSPDVVAQIAILPAFAGSARILSAYGLFNCDDCDTDKLHLFASGKSADDLDDEASAVRCQSCGKTMELEDDDVLDVVTRGQSQAA